MNERATDGPEKVRVFLSYVSSVKEQAAKFKEDLELYGISAFLAHNDIVPTAQWQEEIKKELARMDALVALLTDDFHTSEYTDQEIGFALARGVRVYPVRLGKDPYGFISGIQAITSGWDGAPLETFKLLLARDPRMVDGYIQMVRSCGNYYQANELAKLLPEIQSLSPDQVGLLMDAFNGNPQVRESYGFGGPGMGVLQTGLPFHLQRITGKEFEFDGPFPYPRLVFASPPEPDAPF